MADLIRFPSKKPAKTVPDLALPLPQDATVTISEFDGQFYVFVARRFRPTDGYTINAADYREVGAYQTKAEAFAVACDVAGRFNLDVEDKTSSADSAITEGPAS